MLRNMTAQGKTFQQVVGANAKRLRERRGMSQDDVARRARHLGAPWQQATVANLENGRKVPTIETLVVLASSLGDFADGQLVFLSDFARTDGDVTLAGTASISGANLVDFLQGSPALTSRPGEDAPSMTAKALPAGPDASSTDLARVRDEWRQADQRAADRLDVHSSDAQLMMARLWGESLSARSARVASERAHGAPSPQRKGIVTRQLTEELEADRDLTRALERLELAGGTEQLEREQWSALASTVAARRAGTTRRSILGHLGLDAAAGQLGAERAVVESIPWATPELMARLVEEADRGDDQ